MKKIATAALALSLLLGGVSVVAAADSPTRQTVEQPQHLDRLNAHAAKLGIDTTNKTPQEIKKAIHEAIKAKKAAKKTGELSERRTTLKSIEHFQLSGIPGSLFFV